MEMTSAVKGRRCGTCTLCCKLLTIPQFGNPSGEWCPHCVQGRGCALYPDWPNECRSFYCGYLLWPELGEHWRPSRSKLVVTFKPDGMEIIIHVDPGVPNAWRAEPYYTEIRSMAGQAVDGGRLPVRVDTVQIGPSQQMVERSIFEHQNEYVFDVRHVLSSRKVEVGADRLLWCLY